jgi:hypothetical protein
MLFIGPSYMIRVDARIENNSSARVSAWYGQMVCGETGVRLTDRHSGFKFSCSPPPSLPSCGLSAAVDLRRNVFAIAYSHLVISGFSLALITRLIPRRMSLTLGRAPTAERSLNFGSDVHVTCDFYLLLVLRVSPTPNISVGLSIAVMHVLNCCRLLHANAIRPVL